MRDHRCGAPVDMEVSVTESVAHNAPDSALPAGLAVSHQTALDIMGIAIVCYSVLIEQEEGRPAPDAAQVAQWERELEAVAESRRSLDARDTDRVRRLADEHVALVRRLDRMIDDN
ncbi:hypothetical protein Cme02nite_30400 [Catellatospora methionotrophica]|uniref:Uncharacterized protein n=1 Tax=Catellatospora methionotrophica TaxID=121620 RepID=A0A8J3L599_9ACTN|nr:hypothetical protein [Catellatospora methionotrophica]GIG14708.1 hypothetical protein Cme02nite_30400 [Catellatospora methionotrophica]